jgi:hypothetical protein
VSTSFHTHRSTAFVKPINLRGRGWKPDPITNQFRFIVRMAYACHENGVPYVLTWGLADGVMSATITASGENIPMPKPLPKPSKPKPISQWKPALWESEYRLEAFGDSSKGKSPGFVIEHSSGLSIVHPSNDGELGGDDEDIRKNWFVIHTRSGLGFGLELDFKRAASALLLAASCPVDWTQDVEVLKSNPEFRKAGYTVQAEFSKGFDKDSAIRRLAEMDRAA